MDVDHCSEILQEIKLDTDALKLKIYSYLSEKVVDEDSLHQKKLQLVAILQTPME